MPIYEYQCSKCGRVHEVLQKMSDAPLSECPECSGTLNKRISQCTFHLKGTGWYATDYANSSKTNSSSGRKEESTPKESTTADTNTSSTSSNTTTES